MNKDLVAVTADLANLLRKSKQVAEQEKSKVARQLSTIKSRGSSSKAFLSGTMRSGRSGEKHHFSRHKSSSDYTKIVNNGMAPSSR